MNRNNKLGQNTDHSVPSSKVSSKTRGAAIRAQRRNLIDFGRMKLHQTKAVTNIRYYIQRYPGQFEHIIIITKDGRVIEISA